MQNKKTLVVGASTKPWRYSYKAIESLRSHQHEVVAIGLREGEVAGVPIQKTLSNIGNIHTVTMYVGAVHQAPYQEWLLKWKPQRVIFNPGAENPELQSLLEENGVEVLEACTLVMLATGQF
jgi:predicted CoA-binding protein